MEVFKFIQTFFEEIGGIMFAYISDMNDIIYNTLHYDFNLSRIGSFDLLPLFTGFGSFMFPILFCNIVFVVCCSKPKHLFDLKTHLNTVNTSLYDALRWFRQAEYDLQAAKYDLDQEEPAREWSCFKCQQAAEKAIKSVLIALGIKYRTDTVPRSGAFNQRPVGNPGHDLFSMATASQDKHIVRLSRNLQSNLGHVGRMRYPDQLPYPKVPRDMYSEETACKSLELAGLLLKHVKVTYLKTEIGQGEPTQQSD